MRITGREFRKERNQSSRHDRRTVQFTNALIKSVSPQTFFGGCPVTVSHSVPGGTVQFP